MSYLLCVIISAGVLVISAYLHRITIALERIADKAESKDHRHYER